MLDVEQDRDDSGKWAPGGSAVEKEAPEGAVQVALRQRHDGAPQPGLSNRDRGARGRDGHALSSAAQSTLATTTTVQLGEQERGRETRHAQDQRRARLRRSVEVEVDSTVVGARII